MKAGCRPVHDDGPCVDAILFYLHLQTKVKLELPRLYSPSYLRDWGLQTLKTAIGRAMTTNVGSTNHRWLDSLGGEACMNFVPHESQSGINQEGAIKC